MFSDSRLAQASGSVFATLSSSSDSNRAWVSAAWTLAESLIAEGLLGAFVLFGPNVSLAHELWEALRLMPHARRFSLYAFWRDGLYSSQPEVGNLLFADLESS